jgi:hypothetical protein
MTDKQEILAPEANREQMPVASTPVQATDAVLEIIAKMAVDPNADVTKLEKLIALRDNDIEKRRARDREDRADVARAAYYRDFVTMKPELPRIIEKGNNTHTKSKYALLEDMIDSIAPILVKYGFADDVRNIKQTDKDVTGTLVLRHKEGHEEELTLTLPIDSAGSNGSANKTVVQGTASTISYLRRILLATKLNLSSGDDRDGNVVSDFIDVTQAADIDNRARAFGEEYYKKFLSFMQVEAITGIKKDDYKKAVNQLKSSEDEAARRKKAAAGGAAK